MEKEPRMTGYTGTTAQRSASLPGNATVFLIDDDPSVRRGLSRLLRSAGYEVATFSSAREFFNCGIAQTQSGEPVPGSSWRWTGDTPQAASSPTLAPGVPRTEASCLVLDIRMPDLSGMDLQEMLAGTDIRMPVIFITGHGDVPTSVTAMKRGAVDFLSKPVDGPDLLSAVKRAIEKDAADREASTRVAGARSRIASLTSRELEVMQHVVAGELNKQIAADLGISEKTVKVHRGRVMEKTGACSVAELVRMFDLWSQRPA